MSLYEKIMALYPDLTSIDFMPQIGTIVIQNDCDGRGDYIKYWANSNPQPTEDQLAN